MYSVKLTKSYFQSQSDIHIMDVSIGDVLKETAIHRTGMEALVEITRDGEEGRRWGGERGDGGSSKDAAQGLEDDALKMIPLLLRLRRSHEEIRRAPS